MRGGVVVCDTGLLVLNLLTAASYCVLKGLDAGLDKVTPSKSIFTVGCPPPRFIAISTLLLNGAGPDAATGRANVDTGGIAKRRPAFFFICAAGEIVENA